MNTVLNTIKEKKLFFINLLIIIFSPVLNYVSRSHFYFNVYPANVFTKHTNADQLDATKENMDTNKEG